MRRFTLERNATTTDSIWFCEHAPIFTQGLAGHLSDLLSPGDIPVVQTDRGGQVTYHGPGQIVAYPLIDLKRIGFFVKEYVYRIEEAIIKTLIELGVTGHRVNGAPGIYVRIDDPFSHAPLLQRPTYDNNKMPQRQGTPDFTGLGKIAALGIKVSRNCTYHGLAFNVSMDLTPFERINPCGYQKLRTIDLSTIGVAISCQEAAQLLSKKLAVQLTP